MRRFAFVVLTLLASVSTTLAEARIPVKDRVKNQPPGYCAFAALETLCRHQHVKAGYNLLEKRKLDPDEITWDGRFIGRNEGTDWAIEGKLKELGIRYRMNHTFHKDSAGLRMIVKATEAGRGAVVGIWHDPVYHGHHAIVIVDINTERFEYIDSNSPGEIWAGDTEWLLREWDGFAVTISNQ